MGQMLWSSWISGWFHGNSHLKWSNATGLMVKPQSITFFPWHGIRQITGGSLDRTFGSWDPMAGMTYGQTSRTILTPISFRSSSQKFWSGRGSGAPWFERAPKRQNWFVFQFVTSSFYLFIRMFFGVKAALYFLPKYIIFPCRGSSPSLVEYASIFSWNSHMHPQNMKT